MKILITNHQMVSMGGTEVYTFELVKSLQANGNFVMVYSPHVDYPWIKQFKKYGISYVSDLKEARHIDFDIAHIHHNVCAIEVRSMFPRLPLIYVCHGVVPLLEQPPKMYLGIEAFVSVSQRIREKVFGGRHLLINNIVNEATFNKIGRAPLNSTPKHAVILSNNMIKKHEAMIRKSCSRLGISVKRIGGKRQMSNEKLAGELRKADIVFTIGRGAIESMMCGANVFLVDTSGMDRIVTPQLYSVFKERNFNGCFYKDEPSEKYITDEITRHYDANSSVYENVMDDYSAGIVTPIIEKAYITIIKNHRVRTVDIDLITQTAEQIKLSRESSFDFNKLSAIKKIMRILKLELLSHC